MSSMTSSVAELSTASLPSTSFITEVCTDSESGVGSISKTSEVSWSINLSVTSGGNVLRVSGSSSVSSKDVEATIVG